MNRGFFKLWRKIEDSRSWSRGSTYRGLMASILQKAAWKKNYAQGHVLEPGQLLVNVSGGWADELKLAKTTLQRMLSDLESDAFIIRQNLGNRATLITVVNWEVYQSNHDEVGNQWATDGQPVGNRWATDGQPYYKVEEGKKVRSKEGKKEEEDSLAPSHAGHDSGLPVKKAGESPDDYHSRYMAWARQAMIELLAANETHWQEAYPAVDCSQICREAMVWLQANPAKRKKNLARFITGWLSREQQRGGRRYAARQRPAPKSSTDAPNPPIDPDDYDPEQSF